jgi:endonuclease YncB( thermonuclease family)
MTNSRLPLSDSVFEETVRVEWKEKDRYGRTLGHVYAGSDHVNLSMIRDGYAWHFKRYNKDQKLADAEIEARKASRGLWADKEPIPPWEFRKQAMEKAAAAR